MSRHACDRWLTYHPLYQDELDYQGDYVYKKAEGCEISWKDDETNLTMSFEIKKKRNKTAYFFIILPRTGHGPVAARLLCLAGCFQLAALARLDALLSSSPLLLYHTRHFPVIVCLPVLITDTNRTRLVRKAHPAESFFNFFMPPTPPNEDGDEDEDEDQVSPVISSPREAPLIVFLVLYVFALPQ